MIPGGGVGSVVVKCCIFYTGHKSTEVCNAAIYGFNTHMYVGNNYYCTNNMLWSSYYQDMAHKLV